MKLSYTTFACPQNGGARKVEGDGTKADSGRVQRGGARYQPANRPEPHQDPLPHLARGPRPSLRAPAEHGLLNSRTVDRGILGDRGPHRPVAAGPPAYVPAAE